MIRGIIGTKRGMTQLYQHAREVVVTAIEAGPCFVTQVKTVPADGYDAVQLGFGEAKRLDSPQRGHLKGMSQLRHLREFGVEDIGTVQVGQKIDVDIFKAGDLVDVAGISKGKGFAGSVKRHHFAGGPKTHGQSDRLRAPGSIGAMTFPGRVFKGKRMAGHMGHRRVTVHNLKVIDVDLARHLLLVQGAVPGPDTGLLEVKKARGGVRESASPSS